MYKLYDVWTFQFSTAEGVVAAFIDEFPQLGLGMRPTLCRLFLCTTFFLLGLPMVTEGGFYLFNIMDIYSAGYTLLIVAFFEVVGIIYVYGIAVHVHVHALKQKCMCTDM